MGSPAGGFDVPPERDSHLLLRLRWEVSRYSLSQVRVEGIGEMRLLL